MELNEYQDKAMSTAVYPGVGKGHLTYLIIKSYGEGGEFAEKVGKKMRALNVETPTASMFNEEERLLLKKELGDELWYLAARAKELGYTLEEVAQGNNEKLADRYSRGVIIGEGDER